MRHGTRQFAHVARIEPREFPAARVHELKVALMQAKVTIYLAGCGVQEIESRPRETLGKDCHGRWTTHRRRGIEVRGRGEVFALLS